MATVPQQDFYDILGVSKEATQDEIRKAYRKLAHQYHPDKTGGDKEAEDRLKEINEAYDVLKNTEKRKKYDEEQAARAAFGGYGRQGFDASDFEDFSGFGGGASFDDIFGSMFGQAGARTRAAGRPGADLETRVTVSLQEVAKGATRRLRVRRNELCSACGGSGAEPGSEPVVCPDCNGVGSVTQQNGVFRMSRTCGRCGGAGTSPSKRCAACHGSGREAAERELTVTIPPGVSNGMRLRLAGEGEPGDPGMPRGSLFVRVEVETDPFFVRDGKNLTVEVPVTFSEAALGAQITVPTLEGVAKLSVPAGTQPGATLRMRGMGLPGPQGGPKGDQLVRIAVEVPKKLNAEQKAIVRQLNGEDDPEVHPLRAAFGKLLKSLRLV